MRARWARAAGQQVLHFWEFVGYGGLFRMACSGPNTQYVAGARLKKPLSGIDMIRCAKCLRASNGRKL